MNDDEMNQTEHGPAANPLEALPFLVATRMR
jgi:hypothetical protein